MWLNKDPIQENGGINMYEFVGNNGVNWIDYFGLKRFMKCVRCWQTVNGKRTGKWRMTCALMDDADPSYLSVTPANDYSDDQQGNMTSDTAGDPYGHNGPLEPGNYAIINVNMGHYRNADGHKGKWLASYVFPTDQRTPIITNDGKNGVVTSAGTRRGGIMVHTQRNYSDGCITAVNSDFPNQVKQAVDFNGGKLNLTIVDAGNCPED